MLRSVERHQIKRGYIYKLPLANGRRQAVLVLQNDVGNSHSPTVIVSPLTRDPRAKGLQFSVTIDRNSLKVFKEDKTVLLSQIRTIPREYFSEENHVGSLGREDMEKVDLALQMSLGLSVIQRLQSRRRNELG